RPRPGRWRDDPMSPRLARREGPGRWAALTLLAAAGLARAAGADPPDPKAPPPSEAAPPPKQLSEADTRRVAELPKAVDALRRAGQFAEAVAPARQVVVICEKALGPDRWRTADARRQVETLRTIAGLPEEGRRALASVVALEQGAKAALERGENIESERRY